MQIAQAINNSNVVRIGASSVNAGWLNRLFGCWHRKMSRPFSDQGQTYRTCLDCGARRQFNVGNWKMQGDFYYRVPASTNLRSMRVCS